MGQLRMTTDDTTPEPEPIEGTLDVAYDRAPLLLALGASFLSVVALVLSLVALLTT